MGEYDFTYEMPDNYPHGFIRFLENNGGGKNYVALLNKCKWDYNVIDWAHYAGISGDTWNKKAVDFILESSESVISRLKGAEPYIKERLQTYLRPNTTGFLVRKIEFVICDEEFEISLPEKNGEDFETLSRDIADSLAKNEPVLVLDRLHTYSIKYIREICEKHGISVRADNGQLHPLHSLAGSLVKYYQQNNAFGSEFAEKALKASISLFDRYNSIRNNQSFAHDNMVLNKTEAAYVVRIVSATLSFIAEIEK